MWPTKAQDLESEILISNTPAPCTAHAANGNCTCHAMPLAVYGPSVRGDPKGYAFESENLLNLFHLREIPRLRCDFVRPPYHPLDLHSR
ncbi:hypothetical protein PISMIDRAFT_677292 [Pisolithus microcarpus 441]|uniref:Uncharacterized protein n=1 Tax=Pisolithus microcarpus 441 TaxID=765257 RepID=A0A0C9ZZR3_9AGAM|nr:hypothetical protein PISMIDRAFT_677292 [Pisolithus microcarpus 441]